MTTTPRLNETALFRRTLVHAITLPSFLAILLALIFLCKRVPSIIVLSTPRVLLLALAFLLAACGGGTTGGGQPTLGPLVRDTPNPAATPRALPTTAPALPSVVIPSAATPQASSTNILITYHKSGGIAGIDETLTVYADGTLELRGRSGSASARADSADIQRLRELLASPEFAALRPAPPPVAPDQFVYELTVPGRAQPIVTADGVDNRPVLDQVLSELEKLKAQVK